MPFGELIEQHRVALTLVTIHRERLTSTQVSGVIRQFSKRLVLVEVVGLAGKAAGSTVLRREDSTRIDRDTAVLRRTLQAGGAVARNHPIARELDLVDWRTLLTSAQVITPTLRLHSEGVGDPFDLASRSIQLTKHLVIGQRPDPEADEEGEFALALDHLTRLALP